MIFELVGDFASALTAIPADHPRRRILKLLHEALRRDVHFIDRHSTTLFQCLWNSCWWYDCPQAEKYYQQPVSVGPSGGVVEAPSEPRLSSLLSIWRSSKDKTMPGFRWLRSLRPPPVRLDEGQEYVLRGHEEFVQDLAYSSDGRFLATASRDGTVRVWDAVTLAEFLFARVFPRGVEAVGFSPDGRWLACGGCAGELSLLDTGNGDVLLALEGHTTLISSVCFSPDGRRIVSTSWDGTARLWDASSGSEIKRFVSKRKDADRLARLHCGCFSPNGERFATGSKGGILTVWDVNTGGEVLQISERYTAINDICFSPDGQRLASALEDFTVRIWDAHAGAELHRIEAHADKVFSVAFSPDGLRLASASADATIRVWDSSNGMLQLQLQGHTNWVTCVRFSPHGQRLASASWDKTARVWNAFTAAEGMQLLGHSHAVGSLCFAPNGQHIASESGKLVHVWKISEECEPRWSKELNANVGRLCFSADGQRLACGVADGTVYVCDINAGTEVGGLQGLGSVVRKMSFSPDGQRMAVAALSSTSVVLWHLTKAPTVNNSGLRSLRERWTPDSEIRFSNDSQRVISASDNSICISNASSGKLLLRFPGDFAVRDICLSPDGQRLAGSCLHNAAHYSVRETVRIWDLQTGAELVRIDGFEDKQRVEGIQFSVDGKRIAATIESSRIKMMNETYGRLVRVWDAYTGDSLESFEEIGEADLYSFANDPATIPWRPFRCGSETILEVNGTRQPAAFFPDAPPRDASGRYRASSTAAVWGWSVDNYIYVIALEGDRLLGVEEVVPPRSDVASMPEIAQDSVTARDNGPASVPADDNTLISVIEALSAQNRVKEATTILSAAGRTSARLANALGVCYLRVGQLDLAAATFQPLVYQAWQRRNDVPTIYATNLATTYLLQGNVVGGERLLDELDDDSHPAVRRLREAMQRRKGFLGFRGFLYDLCGVDLRPKLDFPLGDFR